MAEYGLRVMQLIYSLQAGLIGLQGPGAEFEVVFLAAALLLEVFPCMACLAQVTGSQGCSLLQLLKKKESKGIRQARFCCCRSLPV